jgi:hypothetical protein
MQPAAIVTRAPSPLLGAVPVRHGCRWRRRSRALRSRSGVRAVGLGAVQSSATLDCRCSLRSLHHRRQKCRGMGQTAPAQPLPVARSARSDQAALTGRAGAAGCYIAGAHSAHREPGTHLSLSLSLLRNLRLCISLSPPLALLTRPAAARLRSATAPRCIQAVSANPAARSGESSGRVMRLQTRLRGAAISFRASGPSLSLRSRRRCCVRRCVCGRRPAVPSSAAALCHQHAASMSGPRLVAVPRLPSGARCIMSCGSATCGGGCISRARRRRRTSRTRANGGMHGEASLSATPRPQHQHPAAAAAQPLHQHAAAQQRQRRRTAPASGAAGGARFARRAAAASGERRAPRIGACIAAAQRPRRPPCLRRAPWRCASDAGATEPLCSTRLPVELCCRCGCRLLDDDALVRRAAAAAARWWSVGPPRGTSAALMPRLRPAGGITACPLAWPGLRPAEGT